MGNKKKAAATFIRLVSTAGTGFFYVKRKPTKMTEKLEFRKYDPRVNRHVLFKEAKMKWEASDVVGLCILIYSARSMFCFCFCFGRQFMN